MLNGATEMNCRIRTRLMDCAWYKNVGYDAYIYIYNDYHSSDVPILQPPTFICTRKMKDHVSHLAFLQFSLVHANIDKTLHAATSPHLPKLRNIYLKRLPDFNSVFLTNVTGLAYD